MKKQILVGVLGLGVVVCSGWALNVMSFDDERPRNKKTEKKMVCMRDKTCKELNLSPEQDKQMKEFHEQHKEAGDKLRKELKDKEKELGKELDKWESDQGKVDSLLNEIKALQAQMVDRRMAMILGTKKILTKEQFQKLNEMKKKREHKRDKKKKQQKKDK